MLAAGIPCRAAALQQATGEQFVHESWTVEDGLPVNSINAIVQSRDGYLWLATWDGLVRFDGVRFTVFNTGNSAGLPSSRIVNLIGTKDGSLWLRTEQNHLVRFQNGAFTLYESDRGVEPNTARLLYQDRQNVLWLGTDRGVYRLEGDRFAPVAATAIRQHVTALLRDVRGSLWAGTATHGLYRVAGDTIQHFASTDGVGADVIHALFEDASGTIWVGTERGVATYRGGRFTELRSSGGTLRAAVTQFYPSTRAGDVWIGTDSGVYSYAGGAMRRRVRGPGFSIPGTIVSDPSGHVWYGVRTGVYRDGQLVFVLDSAARAGPIPPMWIGALLRDHEGSLWIGTYSAGLHRLKPALFTVYSEAEGVAHRNIYPIYEDRSGALWLGTWGRGLTRLTADGRITNYTPERGYPSFIQSLLEDRQGRLWVGTLQRGVFVCALPGASCTPLAGAPLSGRSVPALHEDRAGNVWLGSDTGLYRYANGAWTRFDEDEGAPRAVVRAFLEARDGSLWMGTNGAGVWRYAQGRFRRVGTEGLPSDLIRSLYEDENGRLWIGTEGRGLARLDPAGLTAQGPVPVTVYRAADGLFDEVIHQILEDQYGRLWMSSNRGIFWVARQELDAFADGTTPRIHSTAYTERDGLRNREANGGMQPAGVRARDGRLWFPTQDGAVVVDPANLSRNEVPPPVAIEHVTAGRRTMSPEATRLALHAGERDFEIAYTALSFVAPENMRFRYRLEGFNAEWIEAGNRRTAFYTNVPPGRYTFRVIASNNEGVWNDVGAALPLRVTPRFYETTWWTAAIVVVVGLLTVGAYRWRLSRLRRRELELSRIVEERTAELRRQEAAKSRFFANVSHEFRTPLTLTLGPLEDLRAGLHGPLSDDAQRQIGLVARSARGLLGLVNEILDIAKLESGKLPLRAREADLAEFLRTVAAGFADAAQRRRLRFHLNLPTAALPVYFDPDQMEKVFVNLLSNAFKFTPSGGEVRLSLRAEAEVAVAVVADSGPGIPAEQVERVFERFHHGEESSPSVAPGAGIGLSLAKDIIELHGGRVTVATSVGADAGAGAGTVFAVRLRLGRAHLRDSQLAPDPSAGVPRRTPPPIDAEVFGDDTHRAAAPAGGDDAPTVLVVDDHADIRRYMRSHLERTYLVVEACDGHEAMRVAREVVPDLIIADVMMPGMDGTALCRMLKRDPELDFIPVILLTARAETESRIAGLSEGADDYVTKPFDMRELSARAANLIASRKRLRERLAAGPPLELHASAVEVTPADTAYLDRVRVAIEGNLGNGSFGVAELAREVAQDRSHLYRRLQALLGRTPTDVIRSVRMERAAQLLAGRAGSVAEIAYAVGFNSVSYFCRCFRDQYGTTPASYKAGAPTPPA